MTDASSPFDELARPRSNRRQGIPASRHGARSDTIAVPPAPEPEQPTKPLRGSTAPATAPAPKAAPVEADELVKTTVHLGAQDDAWLNLVNFTGKQTKPRVDASRSAVVRLALRRLADSMTPQEAVEELRRSAPKGTAGGRPRLS